MRLIQVGLTMAAMTMVAGACTGGDDGRTVASDAVAGTTAQDSGSSPGPSTTVPATGDGGGDAAATTATGLDACTLVDAAAAELILGAPASIDPDPIGGFGEISSCAWVTDADALLTVTLFEGRQYYGGGLPGAEPLDVGDEGYLTVEPNFGGVDLQVVRGEWVLGLAAAPFGVVDVDALPATMTEAARQALDRLP